MAETIQLSESAPALLHRRLTGERVPVADETRPAYQERVEAGLMIPTPHGRLGTGFGLPADVMGVLQENCLTD
jgi:hypothetical protein